jgi:hypothetical protein
MPGGGRFPYRFEGPTPWPVRILVGIGFANLAGPAAVASWASVPAPDALHTVAHYHRYYGPLAGWYLETGWIVLHLGVMAAMAVALRLYRHRLRRVERRPPQPYFDNGSFVAALLLSPILLSLVGGFVAGILWHEGFAPWAVGAAVPFVPLSLGGVWHALRQLPDPSAPPLPRGLCWGLGGALSVATIVLIAWKMQ